MRIRIMELPSEQVGELYRTPFVFVIDKAGTDGADLYDGEFPKDWLDQTGAKGVMVFPGEVEFE